MNESHYTHQMDNWGYYLLPGHHPNSPGHSGLLVAIREHPTRMHYDPETIQLRFADQTDDHWETLTLHSNMNSSRRVMAGRIIISDRVDKRVEFFCYGATIETVTTPHEVIYTMGSTAPVLELTDRTDSTANLIAAEAESIIATWRAESGLGEEDAFTTLAGSEPLILYGLTIRALVRHYARWKGLRDGHRLTYDTLIGERKWVQESGFWVNAIPATVAPLSQE
jgi:hypothetical protein